MATPTIAVLAGDGIGPEVTAEALKALRSVARRFGHTFRFHEALVGGAAIDAAGSPLPPQTLQTCRASDAILLGAVGGPQWDALPLPQRPEQGILALRRALGVFANLRPAVAYAPLISASPLRDDVILGTDILIVRELTGGLYFGKPRGQETVHGRRHAVDTLPYTEEEVARVVRVALDAARRRRRRLTSVDKANVLETSRLWRQVAEEIAREYPDVTLNHMYVDACAMEMVRRPRDFDVVVTENMFGDILSDEAAGVVGSIGLMPSASLGPAPPFLYEPVHGSAPDIAGKGIANPLGAILSAAMLLRYSLNLEQEARTVEAAVEKVLAAGHRTADLLPPGMPETTPGQRPGPASTAEMGDLVAAAIES